MAAAYRITTGGKVNAFVRSTLEALPVREDTSIESNSRPALAAAHLRCLFVAEQIGDAARGGFRSGQGGHRS